VVRLEDGLKADSELAIVVQPVTSKTSSSDSEITLLISQHLHSLSSQTFQEDKTFESSTLMISTYRHGDHHSSYSEIHS